jgi:hypothetical protein
MSSSLTPGEKDAAFRDDIAAQVLIAVLKVSVELSYSPKQLAKEAYAYADAMLAEKKARL